MPVVVYQHQRHGLKLIARSNPGKQNWCGKLQTAPTQLMFFACQDRRVARRRDGYSGSFAFSARSPAGVIY